MKLRYVILAAVCLLGGIYLWGRHSGRASTPSPKPSAVLPKEDKEQIIVNPHLHSLIITTPSKKEVVHLPNRPSTIDIKQSGEVRVTSPQSGFENAFFVGLNQSNITEVMIGGDVFYFKSVDLGFGLMDRLGAYTPRVFVQGSYNFWSNCRVGVTYDNTQHFGIGLTVRI